jgi:hypothetical protein
VVTFNIPSNVSYPLRTPCYPAANDGWQQETPSENEEWSDDDTDDSDHNTSDESEGSSNAEDMTARRKLKVHNQSPAGNVPCHTNAREYRNTKPTLEKGGFPSRQTLIPHVRSASEFIVKHSSLMMTFMQPTNSTTMPGLIRTITFNRMMCRFGSLWHG